MIIENSDRVLVTFSQNFGVFFKFQRGSALEDFFNLCFPPLFGKEKTFCVLPKKWQNVK